MYQGALDDKPTPDPANLKTADNYVTDALTAAMTGKPVAIAVTRPSGCSVKYNQRPVAPTRALLPISGSRRR